MCLDVKARYSRQILFKPIQVTGQEKLQQSHALIIGCGALGSGIAEMLVRAGIGKLTIADRDYVEASNLQRQQLFTEHDAKEGTPKVVAAKRRLQAIRSDVEIEAILDHIDAPLLEKLSTDVDILLDGTDNFETRLLINDIAWKKQIPWIYGACVSSSGTVFPFVPGETPCFRCLLPALPAVNETCDTAGIIAPAVQMVVAYQGAEALKWLSENYAAMRSKLLHFDVWNNTQIEAGLGRLQKATCPTCGENPTYPSLEEREGTQYAVLCGRNTVQIIPEKNRTLTLNDGQQLVERLGIEAKRTPFFIEFEVEGLRSILFQNGRLLIHGLTDLQRGRQLYHQLFG